MKYKERIKKSFEDEIQEEEQFIVEDAQAELEGSIRATKRDLTKVKRELNVAKDQRPFNQDLIVEKTIEIKALNEGLAILEDLLQELF